MSNEENASLGIKECEFSEKDGYMQILELVKEADKDEYMKIISELYELKKRIRKLVWDEDINPCVSRFDFTVLFGMVRCHEDSIDDLINFYPYE
jgi:hypothetical protein